MSRFSHPTFAPRTLKQQTVCIVCQRWFCNIKNRDPKSKFYNTFQKPECYFLWLGDRADTPEAQAAFVAAPYSRKKGKGVLTTGWRQKANAACGRCMHAAKSPEAQENYEKAHDKDKKKMHMRRLRAERKAAKRAAKAAAAPAPPTT